MLPGAVVVDAGELAPDGEIRGLVERLVPPASEQGFVKAGLLQDRADSFYLGGFPGVGSGYERDLSFAETEGRMCPVLDYWDRLDRLQAGAGEGDEVRIPARSYEPPGRVHYRGVDVVDRLDGPSALLDDDVRSALPPSLLEGLEIHGPPEILSRINTLQRRRHSRRIF